MSAGIIMHSTDPDILTAPAEPSPGGQVVDRHRLSTRLWHWTNVVTFVIMLMSGLMIFNAHPRLYWGKYGANPDYAWLQIGATQGKTGYLRVGSLTVETTGIWRAAGPTAPARTATAPSLLDHPAAKLRSGRGAALAPHLRLALRLRDRRLPCTQPLQPPPATRHPAHGSGTAPRAYPARHCPTRPAEIPDGRGRQALQRLAEIGLSVRPDRADPRHGADRHDNVAIAERQFALALDLFGGRQSARSLHFIFAVGLVLFVLIHLLMVVLAGPGRKSRSMITGRYRLPEKT